MTTTTATATAPFEEYTNITKTIEESLQDALLQKMYNWLEGRVHDPKQFCEYLKNTGAVIAGSAPLQVLMGQKWDSDIDVYVMRAKEANKNTNPNIFNELTGYSTYTTDSLFQNLI